MIRLFNVTNATSQMKWTPDTQPFIFATKHSYQDFIKAATELLKTPDKNKAVNLSKVSINSLMWIINSLYQSTINSNRKWFEESLPHENEIINLINSKTPYDPNRFTTEEIYRVLFIHLAKSFLDPKFDNRIKVEVENNFEIALISGVFNEIFTKAAFQRSAEYLKDKYNLDFHIIKTSGRASCRENKFAIKKQIEEIKTDKPLWLIGYSKGGIDTLHFLAEEYEQKFQNIAGLSTIASPILGSSHANRRLVNGLSYYAEKLPVKSEVLKSLLNIKNSMAPEEISGWFDKNEHLLPRDIFYTSLALESPWYDSHLWMILTKALFPSKSINDGIVEAERALFPENFHSINFGIVPGHHLISNRSSQFPQEALIEAQLVLINYLKLIHS